jgi:type II secretory pathway component PulK
MTSATTTVRSAHRRGVALLMVLATLVLLASVEVASRQNVSVAIAAAERNYRVTQARWSAEGCVAIVLSLANAAVRAHHDSAWSAMDSALASEPNPPVMRGCRWSLEPVGRVRGVNQFDIASLSALLQFAGIAPARSDSLSAAIHDWSDSDNDRSANGAEAPWYIESRRVPPTNQPIASAAEFQLIRGFEDSAFVADTIAHILGADSVRVVPRYAAMPVLRELARSIDARFPRAAPARGQLDNERATLTQMAATGFEQRFTTNVPDYWDIVVEERIDQSVAPFQMRARIARSDSRVGLLRVEESR